MTTREAERSFSDITTTRYTESSIHPLTVFSCSRKGSASRNFGLRVKFYPTNPTTYYSLPLATDHSQLQLLPTIYYTVTHAHAESASEEGRAAAPTNKAKNIYSERLRKIKMA